MKGDKLFDEKIQEFCLTVRPDSEFSEKIKQKELYLFEAEAKKGSQTQAFPALTNNLAKLAPKKAKSIDLGKEEPEVDEDLKALVPANFKSQKKFSDSDFDEVLDAKKILDDMGLGTKSKGLTAGDFSGHGSSSYQEDLYESTAEDIFPMISTSDCAPFYMTEIHGCNN